MGQRVLQRLAGGLGVAGRSEPGDLLDRRHQTVVVVGAASHADRRRDTAGRGAARSTATGRAHTRRTRPNRCPRRVGNDRLVPAAQSLRRGRRR